MERIRTNWWLWVQWKVWLLTLAETKTHICPYSKVLSVKINKTQGVIYNRNPQFNICPYYANLSLKVIFKFPTYRETYTRICKRELLVCWKCKLHSWFFLYCCLNVLSIFLKVARFSGLNTGVLFLCNSTGFRYERWNCRVEVDNSTFSTVPERMEIIHFQTLFSTKWLFTRWPF